MKPINPVFEQTCQRYLSEIADIDFRRLEASLGICTREGGAVIPLLGTDYLISCKTISAPDGRPPPFALRPEQLHLIWLKTQRGKDPRMLSRKEMETALRQWHQAWADHDLDGVMALFHEEVLFENWTGGKAEGRENLRRAWADWFANHGGFRFIEEETFIDESQQKVLYRWQLEWPSIEKGCEGKPEKRRGVDVMHFKDGRVIRKLTYSKTTLEIDGQRVRLVAEGLA